ncbi:hypothetical protein BUALT_Bualt05G0071800 [Buddleja alternifolia]|uniref:Protein kinase domain-containing protein n=1 Tax=Buddleja alternifolia TaxID=168488 RepID=A0AAV6XQ45_9LAMI|nr:hypothetical protein BUALT_Bualt05G0071800 [Buddleja alternifolia]
MGIQLVGRGSTNDARAYAELDSTHTIILTSAVAAPLPFFPPASTTPSPRLKHPFRNPSTTVLPPPLRHYTTKILPHLCRCPTADALRISAFVNRRRVGGESSEEGGELLPSENLEINELEGFNFEDMQILCEEYAAELNLVVRTLIGVPCVLLLLICKLRRRHMSMFVLIEGYLQSANNLMPIRYSYSDIKKMSRGFREKLGEGGYGSVYKGKLRSGHDVAIKVLSKPKGSGQDFINEVATMGRIHHVNVVKLVGYCVERSKCALVYEFMLKGSLDKYIFSQDKNDIFNPKISEFGLAKFYSKEQKIVTLTVARGTIGYVAPELINRSIGSVSYKADVYSFGMLLIEMVGLKTDNVGDDDKSSQYFPDWIYDHLNQGKDIETGNDDEINDDEYVKKISRKMMKVGLWCIRMSPNDRPSMGEVVKMLEGGNENLQIPPMPSESQQVALNDDQNWEIDSTDSIALLDDDASSNELRVLSWNKVSVL